MNNKKNEKSGTSNFFSNLIKTSIILAALDRFTGFIYKLLKNGLFGFIFGTYNHGMKSSIADRFSKSKFYRHCSELRYGICRRIESSVIINAIKRLAKLFLCCRMKVLGTFLATFGLYSVVMAVVISFVEGNIDTLIYQPNVLVSILVLFASIPLVLSKSTLSESLISSRIGAFLLKVGGFAEAKLKHSSGRGGQMNAAFLLGIAAGALTYYIPALYIIGGIFLLIWLYLVLSKPEIGVLTIFAAIPFLPTMILAVMVLFVSASYVVKIFRSKRVFRIEPVDILAMAFVALTFCGGFISLSTVSLKPALLMVCMLLGYFITVGLIREREWLVKCSTALVVSATVESIYAIALYFMGSGYSSDAWVDSEMFTSIARRAVGTLDNPNMLAEYLILIIPIAVSMLIGRGEGLRRFQSFVCIGIIGATLILTWSRGAWLAVMIAAVIYLLMWHHRSIWLIFGGILALPIAMTVLPSSIVSRFTSIGNMADSSTSYRVYIWRATVNMISDNAWSGIGIGEGAWDRVYPMYSYIGVEAAPHSHNLYLQIWLEIGAIGLIVFAVFIFMLYQSGFSFFSKLSDKTSCISADISEDMMLKNIESGNSDLSERIGLSKTQLRISAIGPMCGIIAVLAQGITDYSWYNYRLFLAFWLVCGLTSAYIRNGRSHVSDVYADKTENDKVECELSVSRKKK